MLLYATIWIALSLLVVAEIGRPARWARVACIMGGVLAAIHAAIALAVRYHWDHPLAVRETARQGATLYGFVGLVARDFSPAIYVNYLFLALWITIGWRWRHWVWRLFILVMVVNGAIVFARPTARPFGGILVALLLWAWMKPARPREAH